MILIISLCLIFLSGMGVDLYVPALPSITHLFGVTTSFTKLTVVLYLLGFSIGQILFGFSSDITGRRTSTILGLVLFSIASILASFSTSILLICLFRLIQGLGAASASVNAKSILVDTYQGERLKYAFNYLTIVWTLGPIISPIIGGYLVEYFAWQSCFYFYTVYALILLIITYLSLHLPKKVFTQDKPKRFLPIAKTILCHKEFFSSALLLGLGYSYLVLFNITSTFFIQTNLHYSAVVYGHVALIVGLAFFIGTSLNTMFIKRIRNTLIIFSSIVGIFLVSVLTLISVLIFPLTLSLIAVPFIFIIFFAGFQFPNCMAQAMSLFPENSGMASALLGSTFMLIAMLISLIVSYLHISSMFTVSIVLLILVCLQFFVITFINTKVLCRRRLL